MCKDHYYGSYLYVAIFMTEEFEEAFAASDVSLPKPYLIFLFSTKVLHIKKGKNKWDGCFYTVYSNTE